VPSCRTSHTVPPVRAGCSDLARGVPTLSKWKNNAGAAKGDPARIDGGRVRRTARRFLLWSATLAALSATRATPSGLIAPNDSPGWP
jgi:hypothetical protein